MTIKMFFAVFAIAFACVTTPAANAACNEAAAANIRSSSLDDKGKLNMLRGIGCDASDLAKKIDADFQAGLELNRKINEQRAAKEKAEREEKARKSEAEMNAAIAADNARRDAFDQEMADRCGEYPMDLKIGMSEKLLKMGCAGQADLQLNDVSGVRVYFTAYHVVTARGGKVVRLIRR